MHRREFSALCASSIHEAKLTLREVCTHVVRFLWGSLARAFHRDNHASGSAACRAGITSSEPPQITTHEGKGATCSVFPNFNRPFRKKPLADLAMSRCQ